MKITFVTLTLAGLVLSQAGLVQAEPITPNSTQQTGQRLLAQACGVCHLQASMGAKTYGPMLNKSSAAGNDEVMRVFINNGAEHMPGFQHYLKPAEVDAIISYIRTIPVPAQAVETSLPKGK